MTICTQNRECVFGEIVDGKMQLNEIGNLVNTQWNKLINRFHNIELDEYVIMPNHFHGIIQIGSINGRDDRAPTSLGRIIAYFKYQTTKSINNIVGVGFSDPNISGGNTPPQRKIFRKIFQRNYYEHIIQNEIEYEKIKKYIQLNPIMWERDRNNPKNIQ